MKWNIYFFIINLDKRKLCIAIPKLFYSILAYSTVIFHYVLFQCILLSSLFIYFYHRMLFTYQLVISQTKDTGYKKSHEGGTSCFLHHLLTGAREGKHPLLWPFSWPGTWPRCGWGPAGDTGPPSARRRQTSQSHRLPAHTGDAWRETHRLWRTGKREGWIERGRQKGRREMKGQRRDRVRERERNRIIQKLSQVSLRLYQENKENPFFFIKIFFYQIFFFLFLFIYSTLCIPEFILADKC